jgi:hypothetical protein
VRELGRERLDHHPAAEGGLFREVDAGHAAAAELGLGGVSAGEGALESGAEIRDSAGRFGDAGI